MTTELDVRNILYCLKDPSFLIEKPYEQVASTKWDTGISDAREKLESTLTELKIGVEEIKKDLEKMKSIILRQGEELDKKARRNDVEMLARQLKMFQPLKEMK